MQGEDLELFANLLSTHASTLQPLSSPSKVSLTATSSSSAILPHLHSGSAKRSTFQQYMQSHDVRFGAWYSYPPKGAKYSKVVLVTEVRTGSGSATAKGIKFQIRAPQHKKGYHRDRQDLLPFYVKVRACTHLDLFSYSCHAMLLYTFPSSGTFFIVLSLPTL